MVYGWTEMPDGNIDITKCRRRRKAERFEVRKSTPHRDKQDQIGPWNIHIWTLFFAAVMLSGACIAYKQHT